MASSQARSDRGYHQDYIARIRYSNALPPPPIPPKLLEIPNTGLAGGGYTGASFASRLAREQPLNIEADAELGMPIDLIGIPGVFEGDESGINPSPNPVLDPKDRALLRPLASLGKPSTSGAGVSFLRRTEYITSAYQGSPHSARIDPTRSNRGTPNRQRKRRFDANKEEPLQIAKGIVKGFDLAYPADAYKGVDDGTNIRGTEITSAERDAWARPRHPRKGDVKLLDAYPLLPDWDALPPPADNSDVPSAFATFKFLSNPVAAHDKYDERLDVAFLKQKALSQEEEDKYSSREAAWQKDPINNKRYMPKGEYVFCLPEDSANLQGIKRKFDVMDPDRDDDALYSNGVDDDDLGLGEAKTSFRYANVRTYETTQQQGNMEDVFEFVAMALHDADTNDPESDRLQKAAYFYPIMQRSQIRQKIKKQNIGMGAPRTDGEEEERIDYYDVSVRDPAEEEAEALKAAMAAYDAPVE